jgi:phospholipid/cholesterol/gamma-HCH transport system ATP-binding protein
MQTEEIVLENVAQILGNRMVLEGVNLRLPSGRTTAILGPAGSGKSTLLKTIAAIVPPSSGRISIWGRDLNRMNEEEEALFRRRSSFVFQDAALWANRTVAENIIFPLRVHFPHMEQERMEARLRRYVKMVGYRDRLDYRPSQLSMGEQKLVSLARALITEPELLFLDNPLTGLDGNAADNMAEVIRNLHTGGKTLIGCFSDPVLVSAIADDLVILDGGRIIAHGPFREVRTSPDPAVRRSLSAVVEEATAYREDLLTLLGDWTDALEDPLQDGYSSSSEGEKQ